MEDEARQDERDPRASPRQSIRCRCASSSVSQTSGIEALRSPGGAFAILFIVALIVLSSILRVYPRKSRSCRVSGKVRYGTAPEYAKGLQVTMYPSRPPGRSVAVRCRIPLLFKPSSVFFLHAMAST